MWIKMSDDLEILSILMNFHRLTKRSLMFSEEYEILTALLLAIHFLVLLSRKKLLGITIY